MFDDLNQGVDNNQNSNPNINTDDFASDQNDGAVDFLQKSQASSYKDKLKDNNFINAQQNPSTSAEDIFKETEGSNVNVKTTQNMMKQNSVSPTDPITDYSQFVNEVESVDKNKIRPIYFIIGIFVLLFLFASVGFWAYNTYFKNRNNELEEQLNTNTDEIQLDNENLDNIGDGISINTSSVSEDTDGDGLKNDEEDKLGTDKTKTDTDDDGLYDREEVKIYGTDPKNSDTDGDGYKDGEEVKKGYNPLGEGRLLNFDLITEESNTENQIEIKKISSTGIDTSQWKNYDDKNLGIFFRYPNSWNIKKSGNSINLSGLEGDIINIEIRDNKLNLDLVDWVTTQSDFPNFRQQEVDVNGITSLAVSSSDPKWNFVQSIFMSIDNKVFCFNYLNKKINDEEFKEFQEIVLSFELQK